MATDFWNSSHYKNWIVDRVTLLQAREDDLHYATPRELGLITIFFANVIARLGKRLDLRQQVIATAIVYFRRFYLRSSYCETEPFFVAAACCYVAAKAEESPCHLKSVVSEARTLFSTEWGIKTIPSDHTKLGEMEFYLLEDLEFHLTVYHPYQDLADLCATSEADDVIGPGGVPIPGRGKFILEEGAMQTAWFIISDSMRTELCLLYPPYIIAVAALYMTCVLHSSISAKLHPPNAPSVLPSGPSSGTQSPAPQDPNQNTSTPGAGTPSSTNVSPRDEIINFLAGLNVSIEIIGSVCQQIMAMYDLWDTFTDHSEQDKNRRAERRETHRAFFNYRGGSPPPPKDLVTEKDIVALVNRMRTERESDLAHPASGRPVAENPRLARVPRGPP